MIYFQLCAEDYRWWWRSFFTSGSCAIFLWVYAIFYFYSKLEVAVFTSALIYFVYMTILSVMFFMGTGLIGYSASFYFIHTIYGALKVD